jgi:1-aminocyclopropane-1-carboxylate deaminase
VQPKLNQLEQSFRPSLLSPISLPLLTAYNIQLWLKRDDLIHPVISGNKWRKLKYCLDDAISLGKDTLISMGGAYSNHLHALAYAGKELGLKTVGIIRGEQAEKFNPTLADLQAWGMQLRFVSRTEYRRLRDYREADSLPGIKPNEYWLPEGGSSKLALMGVAELIKEIGIPYEYLCVACGTGTTLAGLIENAPAGCFLIGFPVLKNAGFLADDIQRLLPGRFDNWQLNHAYNFGGFAKNNLLLESFISDFEEITLIKLEPVYTAKMLYGLMDLISKGYFKPGSHIIAVHTGGLQGNRGFA